MVGRCRSAVGPNWRFNRLKMNLHTVDSILQAVGGRTKVRTGKITCNCLLAPWTHPSGMDESPSMVVFPEGEGGEPIYACMACKRRGTLRRLLFFLWVQTKQSTWDLIGLIDEQSNPVPDGCDPELFRTYQAIDASSYEAVKARATAQRLRSVGGHTATVVTLRRQAALKAAEDVPELPAEALAPFVGSPPAYALRRGYTEETCRAWELGYDRRHRRLVIPMRDRKGRLVATSGRLVTGKCLGCDGRIEKIQGHGRRCVRCGKKASPKYLHSKGFKRNLFLFGEHRRDGDGRVYVVEGQLDAIALWQAGYRPVVGLLGSYPGESQVERLVEFFSEVFVVPDGDEAGAQMVMALETALADRMPVFSCTLPEGRDPGDLNLEEMRRVIGEPPIFVDSQNAVF